MDLLNKKALTSTSSTLKSSLSTPIQTTDFLNPPRSDPLELAVCMSLCNDYKNLYSFIKSVYIKEQSNDFLEYLTIISAYASGEYRESLFLAQDLLYSSPTREVFLIILKISVNHLDLPDTANHFSRLALEHHISDSTLTTARAVVCLSLLKTSTYHSDRVALLEEARGLLDSSESTGKNVLFYRALTYAHLGMLNEALNFASEGMKVFMTGGYSALVALVMMAKEDFTGSLDVIKRGLKANPGNFLLYAVKLYCKFLMFEHTRDKESIKKAIRALLKACKDCPEDENSSVAGAIKEESSNIDSEYYEDIFKDIEIKITENSQQALKLSFKIAVDIEDNDLAYSIFDKIKENKLESAILSFIRDKKTEELEDFCENIWACELLSQSKYDQGDKSMSVTLSKQAIRLNQNSKKSWSLLGKIYKEQDMLEEAMEAYLSALRSVDINFSLIPVYLEDI